MSVPSRPWGQLMRRRGGLVGCTGLESSPPRTRLLVLELRLPSWPHRPGLETPRAGPGDLRGSFTPVFIYLPAQRTGAGFSRGPCPLPES